MSHTSFQFLYYGLTLLCIQTWKSAFGCPVQRLHLPANTGGVCRGVFFFPPIGCDDHQSITYHINFISIRTIHQKSEQQKSYGGVGWKAN